MPLALPSPARFRLDAVLGPRVRRVLGWVVAAVLLFGAGAALVAYTAAGVEPTLGTWALMGGASSLAGVLTYALLAPRSRVETGSMLPDPIVLLWPRLWLALLLLMVVDFVPRIVGKAEADAIHHLPANLPTAIVAIVLAVVYTGVAAVLLRGFQPLVNARPTRTTTWLWRSFLALAVLAGAIRLATPPGELMAWPRSVVLSLAGLAMVACAFQQRWILALTPRRKWLTAGVVLPLAAVLAYTLYSSYTGRGSVPIDGVWWQDAGPGEANNLVPYVSLLSPALSDTVMLVLAFGALYGVTATLNLLLSVPNSDALKQRVGEVRAFRTLSALTLDPSKGLDRTRLAEAVARAPVEAGLARSAWLALVDPASGSLVPVVVSAEGITLEDAVRAADAGALSADAIGRGAPLVLAQAAADHRVHLRPGDGVGSLLVLPLAAGGQAHGALFATRATTDAFDLDETAALSAFAGQAALALSHAQLFTEAVEKERMTRELALAREVQERLVPAVMPQVAGGTLAADIVSAQEVCGDYYDVTEVGDGCLGILVADVSGKGAAAAFHMAQFQGIFRATAALSRSPGAFLDRANGVLRPSLGPKAFVSAIYAVLDPGTGRLTVARAGHCPALLLRDGVVWQLRAPGLGLGLDAGPLFRRTLAEQTVHLRPGDVVALYTDGIVEARAEAGEEFGYDGLSDALVAAAPTGTPPDATAVRDALLASVTAFAGPDGMADDTTLVVLAWHGTPELDAAPPPPDAPAPDAPPYTTRPAFDDARAPATTPGR
ncbi:MAG TPA: GAF domain-containing SpoIIE family protein phosphatase [Rhodothermales bacterium]|nr:GAF domain-containing SpoIIE family protein phosphatase [Rhodothermales bacterium]